MSVRTPAEIGDQCRRLALAASILPRYDGTCSSSTPELISAQQAVLGGYTKPFRNPEREYSAELARQWLTDPAAPEPAAPWELQVTAWRQLRAKVRAQLEKAH